MSMYLYKYTPIIYTKHICTPKSGHSAASGPPLSRATAAVAAQWWPSSSAAWQNWQTVGKVFRFYPDPYCFGQHWPAFFISHPNKNIVLSIRSPNTFWRTERAKIPTQQWVAHSRIKWEPWQGYQQQPPLEQGEQQQPKNTRIYHWNIWAQKLVIKAKIYVVFFPDIDLGSENGKFLKVSAETFGNLWCFGTEINAPKKTHFLVQKSKCEIQQERSEGFYWNLLKFPGMMHGQQEYHWRFNIQTSAGHLRNLGI